MALVNTILLVDQLLVCEDIKRLLSGHEVVMADNRVKAIAQLRRFEPSVVLLNLQLSEGIAILEEMLALQPHTKIIVITHPQEKMHALKNAPVGVFDFYIKGMEASWLKFIVERAMHVSHLERYHLQRQENTSSIEGLIYASPVMDKVKKTLERFAPTDVNVLLFGESGCGKEVMARGLHRLSDRRTGRFVAINCAAIPENLLESELFGYEKGAFTGANKQAIGKIELAHQGTLFLDEVGDLPLSLQPKLLRFLQERVIERLGGRQEIPVDVRVVAATHRVLKKAIETGHFREDLYYRLSEVVIEIPPLRARDQDVLLLSKSFLSRYNREFRRKITGFSRSALELIESYSWPGNVRELENCIKRAVIMSDSSTLRPDDLDIPMMPKNKVPLNLRAVRDQAEGVAIQRALQYVEGNMSRAAELLGVTRPTLYHLIDKLKLKEKA